MSMPASEADPSRASLDAEAPPQSDVRVAPTFPVVGVGASAGGLDAFLQLLSALPADTGMAFVLVQHLDPKHESKLAEILARSTSMPVQDAAPGTKVQPDQIYVIAPATALEIADGELQVVPRSQTPGPHLPIDRFFRSLARQQATSPIGVVLSGTGADGTLGIEEIKAAGGITFAQDHESAQYPGMPQSAAHSGCVDFVLSPTEIARELARIGRHPFLVPASGEPVPPETSPDTDYLKVLAILRASSGVDFRAYRESTIRRRIKRRMVLHTKSNLADYVGLLEAVRAEREGLYEDILINVTSFFRDPKAFEAVKREVFPALFESRSPETPIRFWTPGCSTGQEAYSMAMILLEFLEERRLSPPIQIFGTDLSDAVSLHRAREGLYPESIEGEVSPERLRRFFAKENGKYRISKSVRDLCIFARQNVAQDPPFSHLDLISCRNLLIYMDVQLQRRVLPTFHYALNPGGYLMLGSAETVGSFGDLFGVIDREHRIYIKKATAARQYPHFSADAKGKGESSSYAGSATPHPTAADWQKEADRIALGRYSPAGVLVNADLDVLQFRGDTSAYLAPRPGEPSFNLSKMIRDSLFLEVHGAVRECRESEQPIHRDALQFNDGQKLRAIDLSVLPVQLSGSNESCFLVLFDEARRPRGERRAQDLSLADDALQEGRAGGAGQSLAGLPRWLPRPVRHWLRPAPAEDPAAAARERELQRLRRELASTREYLQSVISQQEASSEEMRSANEEVLSANEELQSTNEELETAKEELQSVNEELTTVNEQLQHRNQELGRLGDDLTNLLGSAGVPLIVLGVDLRIRRFTPAAGSVFKLLPSDLARPIGHVRLPIDLPDLERLAAEAIDTIKTQERDVRDHAGRWHTLRIHPYRTQDNRIDGAVLVLTDVDEIKTAQQALVEARDYAEAIVGSVRDPLVVLTAELRVQTANQAFYDTFQATPQKTLGRSLFELAGAQWELPELRERLERLSADSAMFGDLEVTCSLDGGERKVMLANARRIVRDGSETTLVLLALEDITERKRLEDDLREQATQLSEADHRKNEFLAMLGHELRNPLAPIASALEVMRLRGVQDQNQQWAMDVMDRQVKHITRLVEDLLDVSRITRGKVRLNKQLLTLAPLLEQAADMVRPFVLARGHQLNVSLPTEPVQLEGDPTRLVQVLANLLHNASKFTDRDGRIDLSAEVDGGELVVRVRDTGVGIDPKLLPHVFELFTQGERSLDRSQAGLGIGLTLVQRLVELHGGSVQAFSAGLGLGSEFVIRLPLPSQAHPEPAAQESGPPSEAAGTAQRVLVIEDNRDSATAIAQLLQLWEHEVQVAHDGPAGIEAALSFRPSVILLDIGLPGMNGYEIARELRHKPQLAGVLLVALTGYGQEEDQHLSHEAGFDVHLTKPVDLVELRRLLAARASE